MAEEAYFGGNLFPELNDNDLIITDNDLIDESYQPDFDIFERNDEQTTNAITTEAMDDTVHFMHDVYQHREKMEINVLWYFQQPIDACKNKKHNHNLLT